MPEIRNRKRKNPEGDDIKNEDVLHNKSHEDKSSNNDGAESLSIEETNRIRAELGLAPLEVGDKSKNDTPKIGKDGEKILVEYGVEIHCKPAENLADKQEADKIKERLETSKKKRQVYDKVLKKDKGLADSDSDDDISSWLEKTKSKILSKESAYDELDEELTKVGKVESEKMRKKKEKRKKDVGNDISASGLIVGHSKESFLDGTNTILVLQDKHVLDENEDEVLINPNLIENETAQRNIRLRKNQNHYNDLTEDYDEWGNPIDKGVLAKYDEVLEGEKKVMFRLDEEGGINAEKEAKELEIKKRLNMERLRLQSLETEKYKLASDFYTEDEILSFRKPKKKKNKGKKIKIVDSEDLLPEVEDNEDEQREKAVRLAKRNEGILKMKVVDNITNENNEVSLKELLNGENEIKMEVDDEDEESDEELREHIKMASIVIEDDFEKELNDVLNKTRKLKQLKNIGEEKKDIALKTTEMLEKLKNIKKEVVEETGFVIDSTTEYCRHIGDFDNTVIKQEYKSDEEMDALDNNEEESSLNKKFNIDNFKDASAGSAFQVKKEENEDEDEFKDYVNVFGKEADTSRGIAGMLKLAGHKGYLECKGAKKEEREKSTSSSLLLPPSKVKVDKSHVEDDAYTKKMDKISRSKSSRGGGGPIFEEKTDYEPQVKLSYADSRGRELNSKQAFRELSWKFHGKAPGKKQTEKRLARFEKEDKMKKVNSCFSPIDFQG